MCALRLAVDIVKTGAWSLRVSLCQAFFFAPTGRGRLGGLFLTFGGSVTFPFVMLFFMSPLQGFKVLGDFSTQGDALGYCIAPLWGFDVLPTIHYVAL